MLQLSLSLPLSLLISRPIVRRIALPLSLSRSLCGRRPLHFTPHKRCDLIYLFPVEGQYSGIRRVDLEWELHVGYVVGKRQRAAFCINYLFHSVCIRVCVRALPSKILQPLPSRMDECVYMSLCVSVYVYARLRVSTCWCMCAYIPACPVHIGMQQIVLPPMDRAPPRET